MNASRLHRAGHSMPVPAFCALMLLGCSLNVAILLWNYWTGDVSRKFVGQPSFAYWLFFIGILGAICGPLIPHLTPLVWANMKRTDSALEHAGAFGLAILTFVTGFAYYKIALKFGWLSDQFHWPLVDHRRKLSILTYIGLVPACLAILGMAYASAASGRIPADASPSGTPELPARIRGMLAARDLFDLSLRSLGLVLSVATLATASLRNALVSFGEACGTGGISCPGIDASRLTKFPLEMVLMFGLGFSAVIVLVAVPTGLRIQRNCDDLIREAAGDIPHSLSDLKPWLEQRDALKTALGLQGGLATTAKDAILVLGPLLSALLSTLLPD